MNPIVAKLITAILVGATLLARFHSLFHQCQNID
jgi:hypothetical protein